jgi:hypothetical protein
MAVLPEAGSVLSGAGSNIVVTEKLEDWLEVTRQLPGAAEVSTLTISGGSITPTLAYHQVDTEGAAATDDLSSIDGSLFETGRLLILRSVDSTRQIIIKHLAGGNGTINLARGSDLTLTSSRTIVVLYRHSSSWVELFHLHTNAPASARSELQLGAATLNIATQLEAEAGALDTVLITPLKLAQALAKATLMVTNRAALPSALVATDTLLVQRAGVLYEASGTDVEPVPFDSGEISITANGNGDFTHGFSNTPSRIWGMLVCKTAEHGYAVNNYIAVDSIAWNNPTLWCQTTQVGYAFATDPIEIRHRANGGAPVAITNSRWRLVIRALR